MGESFEYRDTNKDRLRELFKQPSKDRALQILNNPRGEYDYLDFKSEWPDNDKIAKDILAFINYGGGAIFCGVKELDTGLKSVGVDNVYDPATLGQKVDGYLPDRCSELFRFEPFNYQSEVDAELEGKRFEVLFIESDNSKIPVLSKREGNNIEKDDIYTRRDTQSLRANDGEIQEIIERKLSSNEFAAKEFEAELEELKALYSQINKTYTTYPFLSDISRNIIPGETEENPNYPDESYDEFISKMIEEKKHRIRLLLNL